MKMRLRSILRALPLKLVGKAVLFAVLWLLAPGWVFWLFAFGLYLIPLFRPLEFAVPFIAVLAVAIAAKPSVLGAAYLCALIFLVIGIKDFELIDRVGSYELLVSLLALGLGFLFFSSSPMFDDPGVLFGVLAATFLLGNRLLRFAAVGDKTLRVGEAEAELRKANVASGIVALTVTEWAWVLMLLPLSPFFAAALFFLGVVMSVTLARRVVQNDLSRVDLLLSFSLFFCLTAILLSGNYWGL